MCAIGYHGCIQCGMDLPCYLPDEECDTNRTCTQCDYWLEELWKDEERKRQMLERVKQIDWDS
jgi:G:T-mismatch repair DNA endonuclease (very short patch repair protein)